MNGGTAKFHPYPFVYAAVLSPLVSMACSLQNDRSERLPARSRGSERWLRRGAVGIGLYALVGGASHGGCQFSQQPMDSYRHDRSRPQPLLCFRMRELSRPPEGLRHESLLTRQSRSVEPIAIANPNKINLTAYAIGTDQDQYVTIINKTHATARDAADAGVLIHADGFTSAKRNTTSYLLAESQAMPQQ